VILSDRQAHKRKRDEADLKDIISARFRGYQIKKIYTFFGSRSVVGLIVLVPHP